MRFPAAFAACSFLSLLGSAEARGQELRGIALELKSRRPVADALIALVGRRGELVDTVRTASDGSFVVRGSAPAGGRADAVAKFFLRVQREGYAVEETDAIFLKAGEVRALGIGTGYICYQIHGGDCRAGS